MITSEDIAKLAHLARIDVPENEVEKLAKDMSGILEYVSEVSTAVKELGDEAPVVGEWHNVFRADEPAHEPGEYSKEILANAPATEGGYLKVKKILA